VVRQCLHELVRVDDEGGVGTHEGLGEARDGALVLPHLVEQQPGEEVAPLRVHHLMTYATQRRVRRDGSEWKVATIRGGDTTHSPAWLL
jgi:hypothetical protein